MKEEIVDLDGVTKLFNPREARNVAVPLNAGERAYYDEALNLVDRFFPQGAQTLARMVYGKRASSSLHALAETLRRRRDKMGGENPGDAAHRTDPEDEDEAAQDEARVIAESSLAAREERKAIGDILRRLDKTLADRSAAVSKWPRLIDECLKPHSITPGSGQQVVVFTEYADTADWLIGRFADAGFSAKQYSGRHTHAERDVIRAEFAAGDFEVIVSTDAGNEGIDLQTASVLINWDIPWSLVRLEQRMGRIHRIGQHEKVWLYNLVATDTREGEAHARLLENLVTAANELDGKIFDSLRLITEAAPRRSRRQEPRRAPPANLRRRLRRRSGATSDPRDHERTPPADPRGATAGGVPPGDRGEHGRRAGHVERSTPRQDQPRRRGPIPAPAAQRRTG